jgi:hypothetical protein
MNTKQDEGLWGRVWGMVKDYKGIFYKGVGNFFGST